MRKTFTISYLVLIVIISLLNKTYGQAYIGFSKLEDTIFSENNAALMKVVDGETYTLSVSTTNPNEFADVSKLTKHARDGSVIYATILEPDSTYEYDAMKVIDGEVYLIAREPIGFNSAVVKLHADGSIAFTKIFPFNLSPYDRIEIIGNEMLLTGEVSDINYPMTMGGSFPTGDFENGFVAKLSLTTGEITRSMYTGFKPSALNRLIENGAIYLTTNPSNSPLILPVTIGNIPPVAAPVGYGYIYVEKINAGDFSTVYARYVSESALSDLSACTVDNGELHLTGNTISPNFTVTNGSSISPGPSPQDGFYTRLNADGSIGFSTYLSLPGFRDYPYDIKVSNGNTYLLGSARNIIDPANRDVFIYKLNTNGSIVYFKQFDSPDTYYGFFYSKLFEVINDELYIAGSGVGPSYPVTNGSHYEGEYTGHFTHLGATGNIVFATFFGGNLLDFDVQLYNNRIYIATGTEFGTHPATDGSTGHGSWDNFIVAINTNGTDLSSSYIGGAGYDYPSAMEIDNGSLYIYGVTGSDDYPLTDDSLLQGSADCFLTKISFCPGNYATSNDTLYPKIQSVCKYGLAGIIQGQDIILPGDSLPTIYLNGISGLQQAIGGVTYQWQKADAATGPWADIANAILKDYRPIVGAVDQYYRRRTFMPGTCGSALIHTSDTAVVLVNTLTAPTINTGGILVTCPGSPIIIGGSPTATGGNPPYISYTWNAGVDPVANPTVSPLTNTIYTLTVVDAAGCQQTDQAVVLVYKADAGMDKPNCGGTPVKIGTAPIAGVPGVVYAWLPATDLTNTTIAQPFANPSAQTEYDLTLTLPKSGGGTCVTHDTVTVTPVAGPLAANFAGPDVVICADNSISIGTAAEPGFSYTWSPTTYLGNTNNSIATYFQYDLPTFDPMVYQLSAYKNGCFFSDQVFVYAIKSKAGIDDCGPRIVGFPDETPYINETFSWIKVSGPGNFTGATNLPQVPVSASIGGSTIYGLTVAYNGVSCYSQVIVPEDCSIGCNIGITVIAEHVCPSYSVNNGHVTLRASSTGNIMNAVYTWAPQVGLSAYTGNTVSLTDNIPRTYTVTVTDAQDSTFHCSDSIYVNDPALVLPLFPATDTVICADIPVMIGLPPLVGYTYWWITGTGLSNYHISNPVATTGFSQNYDVLVTNAVGCMLSETVAVEVQNIPANAGEDWLVCSNATIPLGTAGIPNTTYLWEPQSAPWQNGTDQFSAQPQVLVATSVTYTLTATSSQGCVTTDEMAIIVDNSPTIPDAPDVLICLGNGITIGSTAIPGVSYQWIPATGLDDPTLAEPTANPAVNTTYIVTATFPGGCSVPAVDQVTVTVEDISFDMPDIHFCPADGAVALGTNAPAGMNFYVWQPTDLVTNYTIANPLTINPPPNTTTVFTLLVGNMHGCYYQDSLTLIPFTDAPIAGTDRTACKDQPINIGSTSNTTGPFISYSWDPVINLNDPGNPNPVFTGTAVGTFQYILTKTNSSIPCSVSDTIVINVVDILPALNSPTICRNSCVQIGTSPVSGINYQWSPANGLSNVSVANPVVCIDTVATTYTLTANDQSGCTTSASVVVGVNTVLGLQVSIPAVIACVGDNNIMFNPSVPPGSYSYLWSPDNGTLSNINIANPVIQITAPGTTQYNLQITDNITGCTNTVMGNVQVNACSPFGEAGNFMWFDLNENGIQDNNEPGVSGTVVKLYNDLDFNVATTVTDAAGAYYFTSVFPGNDYYIIFSKPAGYDFTTQNVGGITASDNSKVDVTGRTNNFNLVTGDDINNMDAGIKPTQIVPVTLLSFTARLQNNKTVLLNWQTTAEINNDYFDVERSSDGISFNAIGRVDGNGTTSLPHSYSLIDPHPLNGINYYRLRQVDFDGHFSFSHVEVVELKNNNETITAWYNNQNNIIRLLFNKDQNNLEVKLYASNGQLIRSATAGNGIASYTFNLPILSTGVYMLQVVSDKLRYSKKIFISK